MNGHNRVAAALKGGIRDVPPTLPILHAGLAALGGVPLGRYFNCPDTMAQVTVDGWRRFGFDGVQMTMGVTGEAEGLGATVIQPEDGLPKLETFPLAQSLDPAPLRDRNICTGGRIPHHFDAVSQAVSRIGSEAFVLATLRGPMLLATQLRGPEQFLMDLLVDPEGASELLAFAVDVVTTLGRHFVKTGAAGVVLGEAPCSPGFISPDMYKTFVFPLHCQVVQSLKQAGWGSVGLHVCGNIESTIDWLANTGADFLDVDCQTPMQSALGVTDRVTVRGNLDPASVFRLGTPASITEAVQGLIRQVCGHRWILSSGCDISPGTPAENLDAFVQACRS